MANDEPLENEDQLLQDASTLLMFANVAAKQQHQQLVKESPSPPPYLTQLPGLNLGALPQRPPAPYTPNQFTVQNIAVNQHRQPLPPVQFQQLSVSPHQQNSSIPVLSNNEPQFGKSASLSANNSKHSSVSEPNSYSHLNSHKRSKSRDVNVPYSPTSFERGIDNETGRRNDNNAKFAAAALAQAADYPMPLVKREDKESDVIKDSESLQKDENGYLPVRRTTRDMNFVAPPLSQYQVEPDAGIIGCICNIDDDDGLTVQCDKCYRWQHCKCMGFDTDEDVPDKYTCYYCDESKWGIFDASSCRSNTIIRLENEEVDVATEEKSKKRKVNDRKRKKPERSGNSTPNVDKNKRKQLRDDFDNALEQMVPSVDNKENELLEDGISAENYQATYYKLSQNDYKNHQIQRMFEDWGSDFLAAAQTLDHKGDITIMSWQDFKILPKIHITLPNHERVLNKIKQETKEGKEPNADIGKSSQISIQVKPYSDTQKQKFNGISKLSLFIQNNDPEKKVVVPKGTLIIEYCGVVDLFTNYRDNKVNQYHIWGTPKPKVLKTNLNLVKRNIDIVVDSRFVGNESRFIRKSCPKSTNVEIRKYYIPEKLSFRFMVVTSKDITLDNETAEEELRLPWEWDNSHPILKINNDGNLKIELLPETEKNLLINTMDAILYFTECGCSTTSATPQYLKSCSVFRVKKAINYLLRSTRKISGITNINASKPKELTVNGPKEYVSWQNRLLQRDQVMETKLFIKSETATTEEHTGNIGRILPIKLKIFDQNRQHLNKNAIVQTNDDDNGNESNDDNEFLITDELKDKIQKRIEQEIKVTPEIQKSISEIKLKLSEPSTNLSQPDLKHLEKLQLQIIDEKPEVLNNKVEEIKKPEVKKKLSFADYKKTRQ